MSRQDKSLILDHCTNFLIKGIEATHSGVRMLAMVQKKVTPPVYFTDRLKGKFTETYAPSLTKRIDRRFGEMIEAGFDMIELAKDGTKHDFRPRVNPIEAYAEVYFSHPVHRLIDGYFNKGENDHAMIETITDEQALILNKNDVSARSPFVEYAFEYYIDTIAQGIGEETRLTYRWYELTQVHRQHLQQTMKAYEDFRKVVTPHLL